MKTSKIKSKIVSPYYSYLLKLTAQYTLVALAVVVGGVLHSQATHSWDMAYGLAANLWPLFAPLLLIIGFFAGLLVTVKKALSKRERIIVGGQFALLGSVLFFPVDSLYANLAYGLKLYPYLPAVWVSPLIVLLVLALLLIYIRFGKQQLVRASMAVFIVFYWLSQLAGMFLPVIFNNSDSEIMAYAGDQLLYLVVLLLITAAFYGFLKKIGRIARLFYASFFTGIAMAFAGGVGNFITGPHQAISSVGMVSAWTISILFVASLIFLLIRERRRGVSR